MRLRLLRWMAAQDFEAIRPDLLPLVERIVVADHAALHRDFLSEPWSPPAAYRWMRYESPDPVSRLIDATLRLEREWRRLDPDKAGAAQPEESELLADALAVARRLGYSE